MPAPLSLGAYTLRSRADGGSAGITMTDSEPFPVGDAAAWKSDLKVAAIWGVLAGLSVLAVMPYLMQLMPEAFAQVPISLPVLVALQAVQGAVLLGLLSWVGLRMGHRVRLGSPVLQGWVTERRAPHWQSLRPFQAALIGAAAAAVILGASAAIDPMLPAKLQEVADPGKGRTALNGLLASFYGGIAEELQLRLFLMTLLVWLFSVLARRAPGAAAFWVAIIVAALLFGAGHLPAAAKLWGLTDIVIFRTLALNAIGGLAFGWLYWRRGIEMAMLGHFSADIVLHVIAPLLSAAPA